MQYYESQRISKFKLAKKTYYPGVFTLLIWWNQVLQDTPLILELLELLNLLQQECFRKMISFLKKNQKFSKIFKIFVLKNAKKHEKYE